MNNDIVIGEEYVQEEAQNIIGRNLTEEEYEQVIDNLRITSLVQDAIFEVKDFNELIDRNKNAGTTLPHYALYWRNENAYCPKFKKVGAFRSEEDAKQYIHKDFISEFDEWKLVLVSKDSAEQEIYKVNC